LTLLATLHSLIYKACASNNKMIMHLSFSFFSLPNVYRKHGSKYNCWEPTVDTSICSVRPPVSLDLALGPVHANGCSGMRSCVDTFVGGGCVRIHLQHILVIECFVRENWLLILEFRCKCVFLINNKFLVHKFIVALSMTSFTVHTQMLLFCLSAVKVESSM